MKKCWKIRHGILEFLLQFPPHNYDESFLLHTLWTTPSGGADVDRPTAGSPFHKGVKTRHTHFLELYHSIYTLSNHLKQKKKERWKTSSTTTPLCNPTVLHKNHLRMAKAKKKRNIRFTPCFKVKYPREYISNYILIVSKGWTCPTISTSLSQLKIHFAGIKCFLSTHTTVFLLFWMLTNEIGRESIKEWRKHSF